MDGKHVVQKLPSFTVPTVCGSTRELGGCSLEEGMNSKVHGSCRKHYINHQRCYYWFLLLCSFPLSTIALPDHIQPR